MSASINRLRLREAVFIKEGLCVACGAAPELDRKRCWFHLNYLRRYQREKRKQRRVQGLCIRCGLAGFKWNLCETHYLRAKQKGRHMRKVSRRDYIFNEIEDLATDFVHYDRKDDEDLSREDLREAIVKHEITIEEIVERFKKSLLEEIGSLERDE